MRHVWLLLMVPAVMGMIVAPPAPAKDTTGEVFKCKKDRSSFCGFTAICCAPTAEAEGSCYYTSVKRSKQAARAKVRGYDFAAVQNPDILRYKCPEGSVRVVEGENGQQAPKLADYLHKPAAVMRAGLSMGTQGFMLNGVPAPQFWTLGLLLCDKKQAGPVYGLTNQHNFLDFDDTTVLRVATQPSDHPQDYAPTGGPRPVGDLVKTWLNPGFTQVPDAALFKFRPEVKTVAQIATPKGNANILGMKTVSEIQAMPPGTVLWLAGRTSGWVPMTFTLGPDRWATDDEKQIPITVLSPEQLPLTHAAWRREDYSPVNPGYAYPGNSGSVVWFEDPTPKKGFWAVALFSGGPMVPVETILQQIKADSIALDLEVCTAKAKDDFLLQGNKKPKGIRKIKESPI